MFLFDQTNCIPNLKELHVFTVHHGYILSLEKEKNCMEKVLNFAYKNVYNPAPGIKLPLHLK